MRTKEEIEEMINKLYSLLDKHPENILRILTYTDCLSWILGEDYLEQFIEDIEGQDK